MKEMTPVDALAEAARNFGMTAEDTRGFCIINQPCLLTMKFLKERGVDGRALTAEDAKQAERINRELSRRFQEKYNPLKSQKRETTEMSQKFNVSKDMAVKLLVATGVTMAPSYTPTRLRQKIAEYDQFEETARSKVEEPSLLKLQNLLMRALSEGVEVVILDQDDPKPGPKKGGDSPEEFELDDDDTPKKEKTVKTKEKTAVEKPKKSTAASAPAKTAKKEKPEVEDIVVKVKKPAEEKPAKKEKSTTGGRGVGIKEVVLDMLRAASAEKPVTKDKIHDKLVKKFPDHKEQSLRETINYYIPGYLTRGGCKIGKSDRGFWLADEPKS